MQTVKINRETWRCGGDNDKNDRNMFYRNGEGDTLLLNNEGYMCCLGFACAQLGDVPENSLLGVMVPEELNVEIEPLTFMTGDIYTDTTFTNEAVSINDNYKITNAEREIQLVTLGLQYGVDFQFYGEYDEQSSD